MQYVCPQCKGELFYEEMKGYQCDPCRREYPVLCGIPDFRLAPDPYISMRDDRRKGELLFFEGQRRSFAELVRYYYSITPEVPPDHASRWEAHTLAQVHIGRETLQWCGIAGRNTEGVLLDVGCSTAGLLAAAADSFKFLVGVDVAFRWLIVGSFRVRELGIAVQLVCANAEALPFPSGAFHTITAIDVVEHVHDTEAVFSELFRVSAPAARTLCATNNRYAPLPDPHVGVWAVGYVPRRWQPAYVAILRRGLHVYNVRMRSAAELNRLFGGAGFRKFHTKPAPLVAPHWRGLTAQAILAMYNHCRELRFVQAPLRLLAPRLMTIAER
jgi:ubiquinone/menaquinone biosynthesis C-methylase UbiE/uncharacterized protein YbaR (Trm112 family)